MLTLIKTTLPKITNVLIIKYHKIPNILNFFEISNISKLLRIAKNFNFRYFWHNNLHKWFDIKFTTYNRYIFFTKFVIHTRLQNKLGWLLNLISQCLIRHTYADSHVFAFSVQFYLQRSVTRDNGLSCFNFTWIQWLLLMKPTTMIFCLLVYIGGVKVRGNN